MALHHASRITHHASRITHHASTFPTTIPAGFYRTQTPVLPEFEVETVLKRAKLLTRLDAPTVLVEAVTNVVMDEHFQRSNELHELFDRGKSFAMANPEFPIHAGSEHIYNPALKPLLNPDFLEETEGLRSSFFPCSSRAGYWQGGCEIEDLSRTNMN